MRQKIVLNIIHKTPFKKFIKTLILSLILSAGIIFRAEAQSLELINLVLDNQNGTIQVRFGLEVKKVEMLENYLQEDGVLLELVCQASLFRQRSFWWDELLMEKAISYKIKGNALTKEYLLQKSDSEELMQNKDLALLLANNWQNMNIGLGTWRQLKKGEIYSLYLKVGMKRIDVPIWLKRALFFWSWDVIPENSYRLDFPY